MPFVPLTTLAHSLFFSGRVVVYRLGREHSSMNRGPTVSASQLGYYYSIKQVLQDIVPGEEHKPRFVSVKHQHVL
jgi:hypothetical protein